MPSSIETLLNQISNARYGEEVRSAIHDAISTCYTDVTAGVTAANAAADEWSNVSTGYKKDVIAKLSQITAKIQDYDEYKNTIQAQLALWNGDDDTTGYNDQINDIIDSWSNVTSGYKKQIDKALADTDAIINSWNTASTGYKDQIESAISDASEIVTSWNTTSTGYKDRIESAITDANNAASDWTGTNGYRSQVQAIISDWTNAVTGYKKKMDDALASVQTLSGNVTTATNKIDHLSVGSTSVGPNDDITPMISEVTDANGLHKHIQFRVRQGSPGQSFTILGSVYATISDLITAVPNPNEGDMYNVYRTGTTDPPFDVWRYTGDSTYGSNSGWLNTGTIGSSAVTNLTDNEIDTLWAGNNISAAGSKYINHTGLKYLFTNKILAALANKVTAVPGQRLTEVNFTQALSDQISANATAISGHTTSIAANTSAISGHTTDIAANTSAISGHTSAIAANTAAIAAMQNTIITVTLAANSWSNNEQTVTNAGFVATGKAYRVEPEYGTNGANMAAYMSAGIVALDVTTNNSMTFVCTTVPSSAINVKVLCMAVSTS